MDSQAGRSRSASGRRAGEVAATFRTADGAARIAADGAEPVDLSDRAALVRALATTRALLVTAPPGPDGCPGLNSLVGPLAEAGAFPDWIGYLSTTGVYGDRRGGWVTEASRLAAQSVEGFVGSAPSATGRRWGAAWA